jgi:hypothetical protein
MLQVAATSLLTTSLAVFFFGGLATLIALTVKHTIPTVLTTMMIGFLMFFVTTLRAETIGSTLANFIAITPFKASLLGLGKLLGADTARVVGLAENTLETSIPAVGFLAITLVYVLTLVVPMYLYFTRRFEVRE